MKYETNPHMDAFIALLGAKEVGDLERHKTVILNHENLFRDQLQAAMALHATDPAPQNAMRMIDELKQGAGDAAATDGAEEEVTAA